MPSREIEMIAEESRVLVLSEVIPHSVSAGNIQLLRLFADYPADKLFVIGPPVPEVAKKLSCRYEALIPRFSRLNTSRLNKWKRSARAVGLLPAVSPARIRRLLQGFQPELVVSLMENSDLYEAAEKFCRAEKLSLYLIVHDTNEDFERVFSWARARQFAKDRKIYRFARERFCISPEMAEFNEQRFGVPGKVLYPIPDQEIRARPLEWSKELRQPPHLTIGYAGSMAYGYSEMMLKSLPILEKAGARLEICSPKPSGKVACLLTSPIVKWHGYLPSREALQRLQERCDVLWLPYLDPAGENERLYRTHFPSKLFDYLATGMPILVSGPAEATGVKWARLHFPHGAATEGRDLPEYLLRLKTDTVWRLKLAENVLTNAATMNREGLEHKSFRQFFHASR